MSGRGAAVTLIICAIVGGAGGAWFAFLARGRDHWYQVGNKTPDRDENRRG